MLVRGIEAVGRLLENEERPPDSQLAFTTDERLGVAALDVTS